MLDTNTTDLLSSGDGCKVEQRATSSYENLSERFQNGKNRSFDRQYQQAYLARLSNSRSGVLAAAKIKFGEDIPYRKLSDLKLNEKCLIIGTLFKSMKLKPSILKEVSEEHALMPQLEVDNYTDPSDSLILEDEIQRITLDVSDTTKFVTGIVACVLGVQSSDHRGTFIVDDVVFKLLPRQSEIDAEAEGYIALWSGLNIGDSMDKLALQMMTDLLTSDRRITRLIIAGNMIGKQKKDKKFGMNINKFSRKKNECLKSITDLDELLTELSASMHVDIMPGAQDISNYCLPQRPLHKCMFSKSAQYCDTLGSVSNPYECLIGGVRVLGSSGQAVKDISMYTKFESDLDILEQTLIWNHLSPTSPDTLGCVPYDDKDPFVINECPHVYFSANHDEFSQRIYKGAEGQRVCLITVPNFSKTKSCVLVKLSDLSCETVEVKTDLIV